MQILVAGGSSRLEYSHDWRTLPKLLSSRQRWKSSIPFVITELFFSPRFWKRCRFISALIWHSLAWWASWIKSPASFQLRTPWWPALVLLEISPTCCNDRGRVFFVTLPGFWQPVLHLLCFVSAKEIRALPFVFPVVWSHLSSFYSTPLSTAIIFCEECHLSFLWSQHCSYNCQSYALL